MAGEAPAADRAPGEGAASEASAASQASAAPGAGAAPGAAATTPPAWVYLLRCGDGSLYTGWTVDLQRRLQRHQDGVASRYTASRLPVALALALPMPDASAARREEARIKQLDRAAKLALVAAGGATMSP